MVEKHMVKTLKYFITTLFVPVAHGGSCGALAQSKIGYEGLADTDTRRYITECLTLIQLSESKSHKLVVSPVPVATLVTFVPCGTAPEHPQWNQVDDLPDKWLVCIFGAPEESHKMYF
jgi:hypothetical protein